jgi:hypothetical protein
VGQRITAAPPPANHPSTWRAADIAGDRSWIVTQTSDGGGTGNGAQPGELPRVARRRLGSRGIARPLTRPLLDHCPRDVHAGRGFGLPRGSPVERYDPGTVKLLFRILIAWPGPPVTQTLDGELMALIADFGLDVNQLERRSPRGHAVRSL